VGDAAQGGERRRQPFAGEREPLADADPGLADVGTEGNQLEGIPSLVVYCEAASAGNVHQ
jgi:hypothetical protein